MKKPLPFLLALGVLLAPLSASAQDGPTIIFVTENTSAKDAIEDLIVEEYNAQAKESLREADFSAWENYTAVTSYDAVPTEFSGPRYTEIKALLGLNDNDPADKGFTDLLEAAGYTVYRSMSTFEEDPFTGVIFEDHEFWPEGDRFSTEGDFFISQAQVDKLNGADLVIMSPDIDAGYYAQGRTGGSNDYSNRDRWNGLTVPIITMESRLSRSHEWDRGGWGLSYGYEGQYDTVAPFDRQLGDPRFAFPDWRPQVVNSDAALLKDVVPADDNRVALYMDELPELPITNKKFSNNKNYSYPESAQVVLELTIPTFIAFEAPGIGEISTRNPVLIEFEANVPGYQPQDGVPPLIKVGTPAGPRMYFAAGSGQTGLYNLSETGAQVFLNAVEKFAGAAGGGETWYGYPKDGLGWVDTGVPGWFNGYVNVSFDPWVWIVNINKYVYIPDDSGWVYVPR